MSDGFLCRQQTQEPERPNTGVPVGRELTTVGLEKLLRYLHGELPNA